MNAEDHQGVGTVTTDVGISPNQVNCPQSSGLSQSHSRVKQYPKTHFFVAVVERLVSTSRVWGFLWDFHGNDSYANINLNKISDRISVRSE